MFTDNTPEEINEIMERSWQAFLQYRKFSLKQRAGFLRAIAEEMEMLDTELLEIAAAETFLPEGRLRNEKARTLFQLTSYADACEKGDWLDVRIDRAKPDKVPAKPDIRKMLVPLGPVVVFGAANFPFAYSTAGGDTASAFAAGCPVIVKAHPAHQKTSEMVAAAILRAAVRTYMPVGIFSHVIGASFETGKALVEHRFTRAVGFTGSQAGGRQLFDWANQRKDPIPVFAEMSSVNPVFLLPEKLSNSHAELARLLAGSITLGVGQFCTNPGLVIGIDNNDLRSFMNALGDEIKKGHPGDMLNPGIFKNYVERRANALALDEVETVAVAEAEPIMNQGVPTLARVPAKTFIQNPLLHQEVFGPYSLVITCQDMQEMLEVARAMEGQLTATIMATTADLENNKEFTDTVKYIGGRFILNAVPTGVEVCLAMQHGGPYPASTDSRFGSVGPDAFKRFARPLAFQNWDNEQLPDELKDDNPLGIWRTVDGELRNPV